MYEFYEKMINAYKTGDEGLFVASVRNILAECDENPFQGNEAATEWFFKAKMAYRTWQSKTINYRSSKVRMVNYMKELAAMDLPNPFPKDVIAEEPIEENTIFAAEEITEETQKEISSVEIHAEPAEEKVFEPAHLMGVLELNLGDNEEYEEVIDETPKTENREEKRPRFGKRKRR